MILKLPKAFLILSIGHFSIVNSSITNPASSDEGCKITRPSTAHHYGQVRPVEGERTASVRAGYGHHYIPGQDRPPLGRTTSDTTANPYTVAARQVSSLTYPSYAPFVYDLSATATTLTTRTGVRSFTGPIAYTVSKLSTSGAVSPTPDYQSITISSAQISFSATQLAPTQGVPPSQTVTSIMSTSSILVSTLTIGSLAVQSSPPTALMASVTATGAAGDSAASSGIFSGLASLTGVPWTLPPCKGPSPGPGLTPLGCTFTNSEPTPLPTTTYSWSEVANITVGSKATLSSLLMPSSPNQNQSQSWTSDSVPCPANSSYECVVNGTSTLTLGLISQILGLGGATRTPVSPPGTENLPPNWAENLTRCAGNTNMACLVISSSTTTLGPIAQTTGTQGASATAMPPPGSVNASQSWTSNSKPCANDSSWECVDTPSGVVSLAPIASLKYTEFSTSDSTHCANNKSLECVVNGPSTITLGLISLLTTVLSSSTSEASTNSGLLSTIFSELGITRQPSTTTSSVAAATSAGRMSTSSLAYASKLASSTSTSTSAALISTTSISVAPSSTPCTSNASMECLVSGDSTVTAQSSQKISSKSTSGVVTTVTTASLQTTLAESTSVSHNPYPYPSVQSGSTKNLKVPLLFAFFCSLVSTVNSIGLSVFEDPPSSASSSSTDMLYAPLVSSIANILSDTSVEPDGNWGIGVPPITTSSSPLSGQYGGGQPISPGTTSTVVNNGQYGGGSQLSTTMRSSTFYNNGQYGGSGSQSKSPGASPASASVTHAIIQIASTSFSPFPTNFIQPVSEVDTDTGSGASQTTSSSPVSSTKAKSSSSKLKTPLLILFLCSLLSLSAATMTLRAVPLTTQVLDSSMQSGPSKMHSSLGSSLCAANPTLQCVVQGGNTITTGTIPTQSTLTIDSTIQTTGGTPAATSMPAKSGAFKIKVPLLLLLLCSLTSLVTASIPSPRDIKVTSVANPRFSTRDLSDLPIAPTTEAETSTSPFLTIIPVTYSNVNPSFPTWNLSTLPAPVPTSIISSTSVLDDNPMPYMTGCASNTSIACVVAGGQTFTNGLPPTTLQSIPSETSMTSTSSALTIPVPAFSTIPVLDASTVPVSAASTILVSVTSTVSVPSETATSSSSRVNVPSLFVLLDYLISRAKAQKTRSETTFTMTSRQPALTSASVMHMGSPLMVSANVTMPITPETSSGASRKVPNFLLLTRTFITDTWANLIPRSQQPAIRSGTHIGFPINMARDATLPVPPPTSRGSRLKIPSFLLLAHSFVKDSWAKLIPRYPTVEEQAGQARAGLPSPESTIQGSPMLVEADAALPVMPASNGAPGLTRIPSLFLVQTFITDTFAKLVPRYPIPEEQAAQARSSPSSPASTSRGLKSIAAPFLVLIICCMAATFYSAGLGRSKHRSSDEGYDSGWVVQQGKYVDREHEERQDH